MIDPLPTRPDRSINLGALAEYGRWFTRKGANQQVWALIHAGWTLVLPEHVRDPEPYQFVWRRPTRREGRPGRLYQSTGQAYNAMVREREG
jgi:hypothetical protein